MLQKDILINDSHLTIEEQAKSYVRQVAKDYNDSIKTMVWNAYCAGAMKQLLIHNNII